MPKFMFVYRDSVEACSHQPSPEEMQQMMAQWGGWFQKLGDAVVEKGNALLPIGSQVASDTTVTDGPFIEAKEMVAGYTIVHADSIIEASEHAKGCPVLASGGTVEVRQVADYGDGPDE